MSADYTLQLNDSGSWRSIVRHKREERDALLAAVRPLAMHLGTRAKWRVVVVINGYAHVELDDARVRAAFAALAAPEASAC